MKKTRIQWKVGLGFFSRLKWPLSQKHLGWWNIIPFGHKKYVFPGRSKDLRCVLSSGWPRRRWRWNIRFGEVDFFSKVIFVIIDGWNMHKWAIRWGVVRTNQGKVRFLKCIMMECVSSHLQADLKVQFRRGFRVQFLDLFSKYCTMGWKSPWEKHHLGEYVWWTLFPSKSKQCFK